MDWLHFVGRAYYTQESFEREAKRYGVSRRASLVALRQMKWGDRIWLAQGEMKSKRRKSPARGSIVLGSFLLTRIAGVSLEDLSKFHEVAPLQQIARGGEEIRRGCGNYVTGPAYSTTLSLAELNISSGVILLQGDFVPLRPTVLLPDVTFRWGFRKFNGPYFLKCWGELQEKKGDCLEGEFRDVDGVQSSIVRTPQTLQVLEKYSQAILYSTLAEQAAQIENGRL